MTERKKDKGELGPAEIIEMAFGAGMIRVPIKLWRRLGSKQLLMLSYLINKSSNLSDKEGWFDLNYKQIKADCGMEKWPTRKTVSKLQKKRLVEFDEVVFMQKIKRYRINWKEFQALIDESQPK